ncbi:MAG: nucleotide-binding protein [Acidobacteriota bacterium]
MLSTRSQIVLTAMVAVFFGCSGRSQSTEVAPAVDPPVKSVPASRPDTPVLLPAGNPSPPPAGSEAPASPPAAGSPGREMPSGSLTGTILETLDAGSYTYLRLRTSGGETWAAVPKTTVKTGQLVTIVAPMPMDGFESPTLHRKFDHIVFGALGSAPAPTPAPAESTGKPLGMERAPDIGKVEVAKAEGPDALTVAEVYRRRAELSGKSVSVRGKVVKVVRGVMGKNFFHLRDGSGSSATEDDDLTVTSSGDANVGDVVSVHGTVKADRDFGAGYAYKVIVEDATLATR